MAIVVLLLIIAAPIVEVAVLIDVGGRVGLWPTIGLIILTAFAGTALLRHQGLSVLKRAQASLQQNLFPADEVFDGICVLAAGAMLLIPGFVTDAVGLILFLPPFRALLKRIIGSRIVLHSNVTQTKSGSMDEKEVIIDGEYHEISSEIFIPPDDEKKP